ncbi:hypothetical protein [Hyphobacterium sp.]|uniref:hypothetical protein n=1 Tax=Hyphobacterium sp. TaxID=2004662 RepID=UPI003747F904
MKHFIPILALLVVACGPGAPREGSIEYFAEETRAAILARDMDFFRAHGVSEWHFEDDGFAAPVEAWLYSDTWLAEREGDDRYQSVAAILSREEGGIEYILSHRDFNEEGVRTALIVFYTTGEFWDHHPVNDYMREWAAVEVVQLDGEWVYIDPFFASLRGHWLRSDYDQPLGSP